MNKKGIAVGTLLLAIAPILGTLLIISIVIGGGFALPFVDIPWYVWAGLLFLLIAWIFRR